MRNQIDKYTLTHYYFVIDTNQYAGNFERDMCAYMTGIVGECDVGSEYAKLFTDETKRFWEDSETNPFEDLVLLLDEEGDNCRRPCLTVSTPGWYNDGNGNYTKTKGNCTFPAYLSVAIILDRIPENKEIIFLKDRAYLFVSKKQEIEENRYKGVFSKNEIKIEGFRLIEIKEETTHTEISM